METQSRLEATSHKNLATDGVFPKMAPTHNADLITIHYELGQPTQAGSTHHQKRMFTGVGDSGNKKITGKSTDIGWQFR